MDRVLPTWLAYIWPLSQPNHCCCFLKDSAPVYIISIYRLINVRPDNLTSMSTTNHLIHLQQGTYHKNYGDIQYNVFSCWNTYNATKLCFFCSKCWKPHLVVILLLLLMKSWYTIRLFCLLITSCTSNRTNWWTISYIGSN